MKKVCLVTGASRGIGASVAQTLAEAGHIVVAGIRDVTRRNASTARSMSASCDVVELDVTDGNSVDRAYSHVISSYGRIDVVINNAGIGLVATVEDADLHRAQSVFDTNVLGCARMCQRAIPLMRAQGGGVIVQMSSVSGLIAGPFLGLYQASKHALEAMSESMALEIGEFGIRVVLVEPGSVKTDLIAEHPTIPGPYRRLYERIGRRAVNPSSPEDVAQAVLRAIEDPRTPLRVPIGADAALMCGKRKALSDEEFALWLMDWLATR